MATHWTDRRAAQTAIGHALQDLGWRLYGYSADASDAMTDYWAPATWGGVATKGNAVALVDTYGHMQPSAGTDVTENKPRAIGPCEECGGTGRDPSGWTLAAARAEPVKYNTDPRIRAKGTYSLMPQVVSPIPFGDDGFLKCRAHCREGVKYTYDTVVVDHTPAHSGLPEGARWAVEINGRRVAYGASVNIAKCANGQYDKPRNEAAAAVAARIDNATHIKVDVPDGAPSAPAVTQATVSENDAKDGIEIRFPSKPAPEVLSALKAAGWRWSRFSACWYAKRTERAKAFAQQLVGGQAPQAVS
jgi:hypothetical protein